MKIKIRVPASTSNLGPGFDVFGAALTLYNEFEAETVLDEKKAGIIIEGECKNKLPKNEKNIVWKYMNETFQLLKEKKFSLKNLKITIKCNIPLGSGLGSSATAVVGGITLANALCKNKLSKDDIAQMAARIEGHPDNAMPAVLGGVCLCYKNENDKYSVFKIGHKDLKTVILNPSFEVNTNQARKKLPKKYCVKDGVFNISRASLLGAVLTSKKYDLLNIAVEDKFHQPYRAKNIPFIDEIFFAAKKAGAYGVFISGSGPSIAAFVNSKTALSVQKTMREVWRKNKIEAKSFVLDFDENGTKKI
jgi:homoserine kinase